MKKMMLALVLVGVSVVSTPAADIQTPHVSVYGTATMEVAPDKMLWSIKVQNKGGALVPVATENNKVVQSTLQLLKDLGLDAKTIQTSRMEFGQNWEFKNESRVQEGYSASTAISFELADFNLYKNLWLGLSQQSSISVESVIFDSTKRIEYQNETRKKAVLTAREKAAALANALGSSIGDPLVIEEDLSSETPWSNAAVNNLRMVDNASGQGADGVAPGKIAIKSRVQVSFQLVKMRK